MTKTIEINDNNITVLNGYVQVESIEQGVISNGGATKLSGDYIISNYYMDNSILVDTDRPVDIRLLVATKDKHGTLINNLASIVKEYESRLSAINNDSNTYLYSTKGGYKMNDGSVMYEDIYIISALGFIDANLQDYIMLALQLKDRINNESVSLYINNQLLIIE